ncbi:MAG: flavocytochrome c [Limnochordia bacterium]|jgi:fumarate reductase flavoprotein subunit
MRKILCLAFAFLLAFGTLVGAQPANYDVIVVGAGGAGLSAAVEAKDLGANVLVIEQMPMVGGNTLRATGGLNAAESTVQKGLGIEDSKGVFFMDVMKGGYERNLPQLVWVMVDQAADAVDWLVGLGADLSDVGRLGGSTNNRAHRPTGGAPVGSHLVQVLHKAVVDRGIEIRLQTKAVELLTDDGVVIGVQVQGPDGSSYPVYGQAVVMATGGFGGNAELFAKYDPELEGFGTTNHPGATGQGLMMVEAAGGQLIQMEQIQTHPTVHPATSFMITEAVRGNGAILVNRDGRRFVDEISTRDVVSAAVLEQEGGTAYLVFDETVRKSLLAIEQYISMGITISANSVEALARELAIPADALQATIATYNKYVAEGKDLDFGRPDLPRALSQADYYAIEIGPAVHHTMGGVAINTKAQVLGADGPIPGLYAAGEVVGGVHGGNRLGGNALADIVVFGRIAGRQAVMDNK